MSNATDKLSIVLLSTGLGVGGAEQQVMYLAHALVAKGHQVRILSLIPIGQMGLEAQAQGLSVHSLNMKRGVPEPRALLELINLLRQWQPQIVHSHMFHANLMARIARIFTPIQVLVATAHNLKEGGRWREIAYRCTDPWCDLTTQVSQAGLERYIKVGVVPKQKIKFIPNVVDSEKFQHHPEVRSKIRRELNLGDEFVWLAAGRNHEQKDYPNMLKAFAKIAQRYKNAILLIAGDGLLGSKEETLADKLGIQSQVRFLGVRRDIPALMSAADAYLMSSAWEGMPVVLLEASASGLPMVATDVGGNREVVLDEKSGFLVPPQSPESLTQAMLHLMELSPEKRKQIGEIGRSHVESNYSIERVMEIWEKLYRTVLAKKRCLGSQ
ncbi:MULTISPECIES: glycosyltransferase [Moorena]|uniref:Glycosyltransferase n=1 Tax=Moorena producens 3L TaxID=489825 RepID=F4XSR9_9CYAN|nr:MULTISPECIES: glycosyltransferase [Moorena]EGJ32394.1 glycosyltransferase [Moorena producens 3L]NEP68572.1 glycosyltransferase [Moorena sp. SIO3A5]OLT64387.1 glycosyl transferase family 1 [Moorena producens 3L]